ALASTVRATRRKSPASGPTTPSRDDRTPSGPNPSWQPDPAGPGSARAGAHAFQIPLVVGPISAGHLRYRMLPHPRAGSLQGISDNRLDPGQRPPASPTSCAGLADRRTFRDMADEIAFLDATAQAELVRRGDATPAALVDAAIARIERLNPQLNAVIIPLFEKARAAAAGAVP